MNNSISIIISTFGDESWIEKAEAAIASAKNQSIDVEVIYNHCGSLHESRNLGAEQSSGNWFIFLDADDELDFKYAEYMLDTINKLESELYLIQPSTLGIVNGVEDVSPVVIPSKTNILDGNWMVIGTAVSRSAFVDAGGFQDFEMYEDWDLWIRCIMNGCVPIVQDKAVYKIHVRAESRNNQNRDTQISTYNRIRNQYLERR